MKLSIGKIARHRLDIEKQGNRMMMLGCWMMTQHTALKSTKLLKNLNYGKSGSRDIQIRSSIWKKKEG